jgi:hypothetical protein
MNLWKSTYGTLMVSLGIIAISCSKSPVDDIDPPETKPSGTEITSIHSLNTEKGSLNSHVAEWQSSSVEMDFRSYNTIEHPSLSAIHAMYPRIKKLSNGSFLLIYQQGLNAHDVYYAKSNDLVSWHNSNEQLFAKTDMKQYNSNVNDRVLYSSADAIVLDNGDILAFASFRLNQGYRLNDLNNGIMMRRSSDNGNTWSDTTVIYRGTTWEPSALQLSSKEIHVYFTSSNPNTGDSGTALLRSTDMGQSWTHVGKIIRQAAGEASDGSGKTIYTDQMPVAVQLNGSERIAVAFESRFGRTGTAADRYHLGIAYSTGNWASGGLTGTQEGPSERQSNLFLDQAAPYLRQFHSGETLLTCNIDKVFNVRIGNADACEFGSPLPAFPGKGVWGSIEVINDHTFAGVFPETYTATIDGTNTNCARIQIARFVLNHRINAAAFTPQMAGNSKAWKDVSDALFIGSVSQAQAVFRFAYDNDYLYCLVERSDNNLSTSDGIELMFQSGDTSGQPFILKIMPDGATGSLVGDKEGIDIASTIAGTFNNMGDDSGYIIELAIPRDRITVVSDRILFNAVLYDNKGNDTFSGLTASNFHKWLPVELKEASQPPITDPDPQPGDDDSGVGPQWRNGQEMNPW